MDHPELVNLALFDIVIGKVACEADPDGSCGYYEPRSLSETWGA
eukprot:CAMPEP_0185584914 /NCGR_PEP_ID=MMETSP0434-20130131/35358_1 /TAXON_ID=626734 ORGANISM="Favella taraikaensis, Strain Fe Narragansett Bay" /NCGR_SAMPLE_ID=MMETSP0434 /ASSEMBLY_ACC=CAM_ASM_000379 /LENGTH=43 /DNA_ID= /DNA_START= /DNA_END= /DNA_ORIENTATION=